MRGEDEQAAGEGAPGEVRYEGVSCEGVMC